MFLSGFGKRAKSTGSRKMATAMKQRRVRSGSLIAFVGSAMTLICLWWAISTLSADESAPAAAPPAVPELPPLVVDEETPLLLSDSASETSAQHREQVALNAACFVCHGNYEREELVAVHAADEVGCVDCHGASFEHRNDENNITPPDVLYPAEKIDASCRDCHDTHDAPATEVLARWQQRCAEAGSVSNCVHGLPWRASLGATNRALG